MRRQIKDCMPLGIQGRDVMSLWLTLLTLFTWWHRLALAMFYRLHSCPMLHCLWVLEGFSTNNYQLRPWQLRYLPGMLILASLHGWRFKESRLEEHYSLFTTSIVCSAIDSSSSVGITRTLTRESVLSIAPHLPPTISSFLWESNFMPKACSQHACLCQIYVISIVDSCNGN